MCEATILADLLCAPATERGDVASLDVVLGSRLSASPSRGREAVEDEPFDADVSARLVIKHKAGPRIRIF